MTTSDVSAEQPSPFSRSDYNFDNLPDFDNDFVDEIDIKAFAKALEAPDDPAKSPDLSPGHNQHAEFITALNDWRPVRQRVRKEPIKARRKRRKKPRRGKDETREGFVYTILKWPLLLFVLTWIVCLAAAYAVTRLYIWAYESGVTMRGRREAFRKRMYEARSHDQWLEAARNMDRYLGNDKWKEVDDYAYYNSNTIRNVRNRLRTLRLKLEQQQPLTQEAEEPKALAEELRVLLEASVKENFVGVENARLYSETFVGTKTLIQSFLQEVSASLQLLNDTPHLHPSTKSSTFTHLSMNYGRTALCLSGGATFAYYHFGVAKALFDAGVLPNIITGTSGGAIVAALLCTRTDEELEKLLIPALAHRINACSESLSTTARRWWRTGAQFDSLQWARHCSWFTRGSLTFMEAYQRTGRIVNITCIPSDPHTPAVLANYLTSPDCVIWSAVLASAAVPGILNPVVLMRKTSTGQLEPYSFGHKWKDGSLRTDIPLKALKTHFNVAYSIVSQANPHINLFFFSSRGTVGRPVTHRRGRGWRGGFLGSATEQYLKLDLTKWLKVLRHLELLPRYAEQDWSNIWLQRFDGTITIWPRSRVSDFWHILSDPSPERLARMLWTGMQSTWPKIKFVQNRMLTENAITNGFKRYAGDMDTIRVRQSLAEGMDIDNSFVAEASSEHRPYYHEPSGISDFDSSAKSRDVAGNISTAREGSAVMKQRLANIWPSSSRVRSEQPSMHLKRHSWTPGPTPLTIPDSDDESKHRKAPRRRRGSIIEELSRQSRVFMDDTEPGDDSTSASDEGSEDEHLDSQELDGDIDKPTEAFQNTNHLESYVHPELDGGGVGDVIAQ